MGKMLLKSAESTENRIAPVRCSKTEAATRPPGRQLRMIAGSRIRATDEKTRDQKRATEEHGTDRTNDRNGETVGQGAASSKGLTANITPENCTRMHDVFVNDRGAPRVSNVDFALSVGTPVPRSFRIIAVPVEIIEIEPQWRGYEFFMVGDRVVIVDPRLMEIVAIFNV